MNIISPLMMRTSAETLNESLFSSEISLAKKILAIAVLAFALMTCLYLAWRSLQPAHNSHTNVHVSPKPPVKSDYLKKDVVLMPEPEEDEVLEEKEEIDAPFPIEPEEHEKEPLFVHSDLIDSQEILPNDDLAMEKLQEQKMEEHLVEEDLIQEQEPQTPPEAEPVLEISWINAHPDYPLRELGLVYYDQLVEFLKNEGSQLKILNLKGFRLNDAQFEQLIAHCSNIKHVVATASEMTDQAVQCLKGKSLVGVHFYNGFELTDRAVAALEGMQLESVTFEDARALTNNALKVLQGMPLKHLNVSGCNLLGDVGFEHLRGMQLITLNISACFSLTDKGLEILKGMPLTHLHLMGVLYHRRSIQTLKRLAPGAPQLSILPQVD